MSFMKYDKLVRDNIIEIIESNGRKAQYHVVDDEKYVEYLIMKLNEEVQEFTETPTVEELADIKEVMDALQTLDEYSGLEPVQKNKANKNGKFEKRIVLDGVESP